MRNFFTRNNTKTIKFCKKKYNVYEFKLIIPSYPRNIVSCMFSCDVFPKLNFIYCPQQYIMIIVIYY